METIESTVATATATGTSIGMLQAIGQWAAERGHSLDAVVEAVEGLTGTDFEDQAVAARAYFRTKQRAAQDSLEVNQIVKGVVAGHFVILGFRTCGGEDGAQLKPIDPDDHSRAAEGEIWLPLRRIRAI